MRQPTKDWSWHKEKPKHIHIELPDKPYMCLWCIRKEEQDTGEDMYYYTSFTPGRCGCGTLTCKVKIQ